jgi:FADH2 O2-dependent halogenase
MQTHKTAIAIIGGGFGGCLMALVLQKIGLDAIVIEKGSHPRFAIGESSTPLANLHLKAICEKYDLPAIQPLCKYGSWQTHYPELPCGLKRGFSYFKHEENKHFAPAADHRNELLVAASPNDTVGDTQWFREKVDEFFYRQTLDAGIPCFDRTAIIEISTNGSGWEIHAQREKQDMAICADFLIDASGASTVLANLLDLHVKEAPFHSHSWSVYSHFVDVLRWQDILADSGGKVAEHPFSCDDAALHHIFDDGWMWLLRFNNGVTSAGFVIDGGRTPFPAGESGTQIWQRLLAKYPAVAKQFSTAKAVQPFFVSPRLQRRARLAAGENWAMLPYSAFFIDPFYSSGIAYTALCIERLAEIFQEHWTRNSFAPRLAEYSAKVQQEAGVLDILIHGSFRAFRHFDLFVAFSMYYFTGAIYSETRHRQGNTDPFDGFLFSGHPPFRQAVENAYRRILELGKEVSPSRANIAAFTKQVAEDIAPHNLAGLCDAAKMNMYPFV